VRTVFEAGMGFLLQACHLFSSRVCTKPKRMSEKRISPPFTTFDRFDEAVMRGCSAEKDRVLLQSVSNSLTPDQQKMPGPSGKVRSHA